MRKLLLLIGLLFSLVLHAQDVNMHNGTVSRCSGTFYDSGGATGDYGTFETYVMTICPSTPGTYIQLDFTYFSTEGFPSDFMTIYNGSGTGGTVIGRYGGANSPSCDVIASSHPSGCITIRFDSDGSLQYGGWAANIMCSNVPGGSPLGPPGSSVCAGADPFCANAGALQFPNTTDGCVADAPAVITDNSCLVTAPNPTWYYLEIGIAGDLDLEISQTTAPNGAGDEIDVDYVIWGPFSNITDACSDFTQGDCLWDHNCWGNVIDCSYSDAGIENAVIPNAQVGEIYMVLITNYEGVSGYITMSQTNSGPGAGSTDCGIVCPVFAGNNPSACGATDGSIRVTGLDPNTSYTVTYLDDGTPASTTQTSNASGQILITGLNAGNYTNLITNYPGCTSATGTVTLVAVTAPSINTITTNSPICSGGGANFLITGTSNATVTFNINGGASQTIVLTGGSATVAVTPALANVTLNTISINVVGCSAPVALSRTVTVNPAMTIALTSAAATTNQSVCTGTGITNITYAITNATGATVSGLPAGITGNYAGGNFTIGGSTALTGTFNYTVTPTGGCGSASLGGSITVNPAMTIALTSAAATTSQSVCTGVGITNITYAITNATGATVSGLPAGITGNYAGGNFTISGSTALTGTFNYMVTPTGGCGSPSLGGSITVNPAMTIALTSAAATTNQSVCTGVGITNITYAITNATGATVSGLPAGITGNYAGGNFTISGSTALTGTFNYTVTPTGSCGSPSLGGSISVNPAMTIALTSAAATTSQSVCTGVGITNITYAITNATGATVSGLPAGITGNYAGGNFTISGTPAVSGTFNYTVSTIGGCSPQMESGSIVIHSDATLVQTSTAGTETQIVCANSPVATLTYAVGASGTGATVTGLPTGITGNFSGGVFTISGTPTVLGTFNFTVTATGSGCASPSLSGTVTVNPGVTLALTSPVLSANQTICSNTAIAPITYSVTNGTGATVSGLPTGVAGSFSVGILTISGTPTVSGNFNYSVNTTAACGSASLGGTIAISPVASIALSSVVATTAQTICVHSPIANIAYTISGGATGATVTGLPTGITGNFSGGIFTISGTPTTSGAFSYNVTTTGGCGSASLGGSITVNPAMAIALTSAAATTSQSICTGVGITNITYAITDATGATVTGLPAGITGNYAGGNFTISGSTALTGTFNYTVMPMGGCGSASLGGSISVGPVVSMVLGSAAATMAQTVCIDSPIAHITYTILGGATGANVTGLPTGITGNFSGGIFTIGGTPTTSGTFNYTVTTTGGCGSASLGGSITVNPEVTLALTSATGTDNQILCINTAINTIEYATANGVTGVTAFGLPTGVNGVFNNATGLFTISGTPTIAGVFSYMLQTIGGCGPENRQGFITVNPDINLVYLPGGSDNQTVCINTPIVDIRCGTANNTAASLVFASGLPTGLSSSFVNDVLTISGAPTQSGLFSYTVTASGPCGFKQLTGTITVAADASIALSSVPGANLQTICIHTAITPVSYLVAGGATGATVTGLPAGITGNFSGGIFTISGTPSASGTFHYAVTATGSGCVSPSLAGTITVLPEVSLTLTSAVPTTTQSVCIGTGISPIAYTVGNGASGAVVTGLPTGISADFSAGVMTISGSPSVAGTFNYTITTSGGCGSKSLTGAIVVQPNVAIQLISAVGSDHQVLCIGTPIQPVQYAVANGSGTMVAGLPAGITASYTAGILTLSGSPSVSGEFNFNVTTTGGCGSAGLGGSLSVNPNTTLALASAPASTQQILCINSVLSPIAYTVANGGTNVTVIGLPSGINGVFNSTSGIFTLSGTPTTAGIFNYTVATVGGCGTVSLGGSITVNIPATAVLNYPASPYCTSLTAPQPLMLSGTGIYTGGTFTSTTGLSLNASTGAINPALSAPGNYVVTYHIPPSGGCQPAPVTASVRITAVPTVAISYNGPFCTSVNTAQAVTMSGTNAYMGGIFTSAVGLSINPATGAINPSLSAPGNYVVTYHTLALGGCTSVPASATVRINATPDVIAPSAVQICSEEATNISLGSNVPGTVFNWTVIQNNVSGATAGSGNSISQMLTLSGNGLGRAVYTIVPSTADCTGNAFVITVIVNPLPQPQLTGGVICRNPASGIVERTLWLNSGLNDAVYDFVWTHDSGVISGANSGIYEADEPGIYTVVATHTATGCVSYPATAVVTESEVAKIALINGNEAFTENPVITVTVQGSGMYEYQLDYGAPQSSNVFANVNIGGHTIRITDADGCTDIVQTFTLIGYPKFFTPNSDGYNDRWNIWALAGQDASQISIFDRYGKLVKQISPSGNGWDGTYNGHPLPATDYWFVVEYIDGLVKKEFKAHFALKR